MIADSASMVDVLLEPMLDRHRELLGALDPVELVEEAPVVDVEISVDQDVSQTDGLGEACADGARDHGVRGERAERLGIGLWSGGAGSREDVQGDVRSGLCEELRVPLPPVLNDFVGEERVAATSTQRAQDAQRSLQRSQPSADDHRINGQSVSRAVAPQARHRARGAGRPRPDSTSGCARLRPHVVAAMDRAAGGPT